MRGINVILIDASKACGVNAAAPLYWYFGNIFHSRETTRVLFLTESESMKWKILPKRLLQCSGFGSLIFRNLKWWKFKIISIVAQRRLRPDPSLQSAQSNFDQRKISSNLFRHYHRVQNSRGEAVRDSFYRLPFFCYCSTFSYAWTINKSAGWESNGIAFFRFQASRQAWK